MTLLQIVADSSAIAKGAVAQQQTLNLFDLIMKGGWVMYPLAVLSVISVYLMVERYIPFFKVCLQANLEV